MKTVKDAPRAVCGAAGAPGRAGESSLARRAGGLGRRRGGGCREGEGRD